ncbi:orexigenic neuropeptide QRFP [Varanus komodoensis]|uniref:Pyroglutamylated RFamide peptide n=1 Tax=Varanus komodoensis TaxID=61221 RepID=A0A8D2KTZ3_VARKO|nr:orexigenic neuropeptide QRFP [Varanus komodoensis]
MKISCPFSCCLLLGFGACFPPGEGCELRCPGGGEFQVMEEPPSPLGEAEGPKRRRSPEDPNGPLFGIAQGLQKGFRKERAGIQFRFGRRPDGPRDESEAASFLPRQDGQKRGTTLGSLAEELNGYNRKKGGFSFRFGRGRRRDTFV